ncbi:MAG: hypothetical protein ABW004_08430, partial [Aeromicrobium sp.]
CDTDHSDPWPAQTCAANTGPVNRRVHNLKTEGLIRMRQTSPGVFTWTTSTGHTYTRHPDPVPVAGWDSQDWHDELTPAPTADDFTELCKVLTLRYAA